jgi:hypothetical protein
MKKLIRKWARWFFQKQIRVYAIRKSMTLEMLMYANPKGLQDALERDMVWRIAEKMHEEGLIEFREIEDYESGSRILEANFRSI